MASRLETSQEYEAAFEELYNQSPVPQVIRPSQNPVPFPTRPVQNGSGIKAIFDMMKLKNSSLSSSQLNSSFTTASTSGGDADNASHHSTGAAIPKDKENLTPEKTREQKTQTSNIAAQFSPAENASDESQADQETLQLVSKLVQRLHSSADARENDSEQDDSDWDTAGFVNPRNTAFCSVINPPGTIPTVKSKGTDISHQSTEAQASKNGKAFCHLKTNSCTVPDPDPAVNDSVTKKLNKKPNSTNSGKLIQTSLQVPERHTEKSKAVTSVHNLRPRSKLNKVLDRTKSQNIKTKSVKKTSTAAKVSVQQITDSQNVPSRSLNLRKKCRTIVIEESSGDKALVQVGTGQLYPVKNSWPRNLPDAQDSADVDADVIPKKATRKMHGRKDPFSLDCSGSDNDLEVEEDAILMASKKSQISKPGSKGSSRLASKVSGHAASTEKGNKTGSVTAKEKKASEDKNKVFKLRSWSLQPVPRMKGVRVEGKIGNAAYFWMSSVIVERVSSRRLKSTNGSVYMLVGNIRGCNTMAAGFSQKMVNLFRSGFPENWKDLIESNLHAIKLNAPTPLNHTSVIQDGFGEKKTEAKVTSKETVLSTPKSREKRKSIKRKNIAVLFQSEKGNSDFAVTPTKTLRVSPKKPTKSKGASGEIPVTPKGTVHTQSLLRKKDLGESPTIWTPQGVIARALEATDVRRTLSGRAVIPPLARWAGQYVKRDDSGNVTIGFASMAAEKHFAQLAEREMHAPNPKRNSTLANSYLRMKSFTCQNSPLATQQTKKQRKATTGKSHVLSSQSVETTVHTRQSTCETVRNTFESDVRMDISVDNVVNEVMEFVHQSKAKRTKTVRKRITCYSVTSQQKDEGEVLSRSFEYLQQEENIADSRMQAGTVSSSTVARKLVSAEKMQQDASVNKKSQGAFQLDSEGLLAQKDIDSVKPFRRKKARSSVQVESSETDDNFDLKTVTSSPVILHNKEDTDARAQGQRKQSCSPKQSIHQQKTRGRKKNVTNTGKMKHIGSHSHTKKKTKSDQTDDMSLSHISDSYLTSSVVGVNKDGTRKQKTKTLKGAPKTPDDQNPKTVGKVLKKDTKLKKAPKTSALKTQEDERPWSKEEIKKLHEAAEIINSNSSQFWEEVSQHVRTRSVKECAAFYLKDKPHSSKPKDDKKTKQEKMAPSLQLQAKKGTLKRRREIRAILEQGVNNTEQDDLFVGTPFRARKRAKGPHIDFSKTDEEVFGRNPDFFTPKRDGSHMVGAATSHTPVSTRKTPSVAPAHSPWLNEDNSTKKRDVDQYIFRLKKNKQQLKKPFQKEQTVRKLATESTLSTLTPSMKHFRKSPAAPNGLFRISEGQSCEDEEEEDYYYSDDADN